MLRAARQQSGTGVTETAFVTSGFLCRCSCRRCVSAWLCSLGDLFTEHRKQLGAGKAETLSFLFHFIAGNGAER